MQDDYSSTTMENNVQTSRKQYSAAPLNGAYIWDALRGWNVNMQTLYHQSSQDAVHTKYKVTLICVA